MREYATAHAAATHKGAHFRGVINAMQTNRANAADVWPEGNEFIALRSPSPGTV